MGFFFGNIVFHILSFDLRILIEIPSQILYFYGDRTDTTSYKNCTLNTAPQKSSTGTSSGPPVRNNTYKYQYI